MNKNEWKESIEIDDDEMTNVMFDNYQMHDEMGNCELKAGIDVHFVVSNNVVEKMLSESSDLKEVRDILDDLKSEEGIAYTDFYATFFNKEHIECTLIVTFDNDKAIFTESHLENNDGVIVVPDEFKQALIEKVEEYHDMTLDKIIEHKQLDIEYEE